MTLPRRIAAARVLAGLSQAELGQRLGKAQSTVQRWEQGTGKLPNDPDEQRAWLRRIAEECDIPLAWFWADLDRLDLILGDDAPDYVRPAPGDGAPGIPGDTGRRLRAGQPTGKDPAAPGSSPDRGARTGTGG